MCENAPVQVRLVTQPFEHSADLHDFFMQVVDDADLINLRIAVAWVRASALDRVRDEVSAITARGHSSLILGIDERGASEDGLRIAKELFSEVFVFHDPGGGTFHPKVYSAASEERAIAFIGSNNLTAGGLYWNHEAAVELQLDLTADNDRGFLGQLELYFDRLIGDSEVCLPLTDDLLERLLAERRFGIGPEHRPSGLDEGEGPEDDESAVGDEPSQERIFGRSCYARRRDPRRRARTIDRQPRQTPPSGAPAPRPGPAAGRGRTAATGAAPTVVKRWTKTLSASDAQQKSTSRTQVTGNIKLTEAGHDFDWTTYFHDTFFADLDWQSTEKPRGTLETADVDVEVFIDGVSVGTYEMVVDHAAYRRLAGTRDQSNVPTWLKWRAFGAYLREHPLAGRVASLERMSDGSFRLHIQDGPTGPFLP